MTSEGFLMADNNYALNNDEKGSINISDGVVASIAALATNEVAGISGLNAPSGVDISELLGKKSLTKGVRLKTEDDGVAVDMYITVKYGFKIPEVAAALQEAVIGAVEAMTGLKTSTVNVHVTDIDFSSNKD